MDCSLSFDKSYIVMRSLYKAVLLVLVRAVSRSKGHK